MAIAALAPERQDRLLVLPHYRCRKCLYEWGGDLSQNEAYATHCAYAIATSVSHTPPAVQIGGLGSPG